MPATCGVDSEPQHPRTASVGLSGWHAFEVFAGFCTASFSFVVYALRRLWPVLYYVSWSSVRFGVFCAPSEARKEEDLRSFSWASKRSHSRGSSNSCGLLGTSACVCVCVCVCVCLSVCVCCPVSAWIIQRAKHGLIKEYTIHVVVIICMI